MSDDLFATVLVLTGFGCGWWFGRFARQQIKLDRSDLWRDYWIAVGREQVAREALQKFLDAEKETYGAGFVHGRSYHREEVTLN